MGIFGFGASIMRGISPTGDANRSRPVSSGIILNRITETMYRLGDGVREKEAAWTRYGSNSAGSYDYHQLQKALKKLSPSQRTGISEFLDDHPDDYRAAGTIGRVAIDLMDEPQSLLLANTILIYDDLDIPEIHDDYWYYPLDVIRGIETPITAMSADQRQQVVSTSVFTLVCAVAIGGLRFCAHYTPEGALVLRDDQIKEFVTSQSFGTNRLKQFFDDNPTFDEVINVATIEGYFIEGIPTALRIGFL